MPVPTLNKRISRDLLFDIDIQLPTLVNRIFCGCKHSEIKPKEFGKNLIRLDLYLILSVNNFTYNLVFQERLLGGSINMPFTVRTIILISKNKDQFSI